MISYWEYSDDSQSFTCNFSFVTNPILAIDCAFKEKTKKKYLLKGRNGKIFYFCQNKVQYAEDDKKNKDNKIFLCVLNSDNSYENSDGTMRGNLEEQIEIKQNSPLYKYLKPTYDKIKFKYNDIRLHQTPPTLIDCGEEAGSYLVFSLFEKDLYGPTLYFHSLKTNTSVFSIKGGEVFIDFVTSENNKATGTLYYLTDKYYFKKQWKQISTTNSLKRACSKLYSESQIVRVQYSLDPDSRNNPAIKFTKLKLVMPNSFKVIDTEVFQTVEKSSKWVTSIVPIQRNTDSQKLEKFALITEDHITKDSSVRIMQLNNDDSCSE